MEEEIENIIAKIILEINNSYSKILNKMMNSLSREHYWLRTNDSNSFNAKLTVKRRLNSEKPKE